MEDHFRGATPLERFQNNVLNELRQIRQLLEERDSKTLPQVPETKAPPKPRGRGANKNADHSIFKNVR